MSENEKNTQGQKVRTSGLAIASLVLGALGFYMGITALAGLVLGILALFQITYSKGKVGGLKLAILGTTVSGGVILLYGSILMTLPYRRDLRARKVCRDNLTRLKKAMLVYSSQYDGRYPTPNRWCDLLVEDANVVGLTFHCRAVREENYRFTINRTVEHSSPWFHTVEYTDPNGIRHYVKRSNYSMNPNCEPDSPKDVVLLFESKGGWNQYGGAELLTTENHKGKGCNILFNDGHMEFVKPKNISKLNWGKER